MAYSALTTIIDSLIVQPLNYNRETQLEGALAAFYAPTRTLSDLVVIEYRDHVLRYARRFFHHLLGHRRLQKAFLLANDIGAHDLFLDVHHMALHFKVRLIILALPDSYLCIKKGIWPGCGGGKTYRRGSHIPDRGRRRRKVRRIRTRRSTWNNSEIHETRSRYAHAFSVHSLLE